MQARAAARVARILLCFLLRVFMHRPCRLPRARGATTGHKNPKPAKERPLCTGFVDKLHHSKSASQLPCVPLLSDIESVLHYASRAASTLASSCSGHHSPRGCFVSSSSTPKQRIFVSRLKKQLPCAAYLDGDYDVKDLYAGVPVIIGKQGIEKVIKISLNAQEKKDFDNSIEAVKELFSAAKKIDINLK